MGRVRAVKVLSTNLRELRQPQCSVSCLQRTCLLYQSEDGGRVFFDELRPRWPKHPCTDRTRRNQPTNTKTKEFSANERKYKWEKDGWEPFLCTLVEESEGGMTKITGRRRDQHELWTLWILGTCPALGEYPILIKTMDRDKGKYCIATFTLDKRKRFREFFLDCHLPRCYWT